MNNLEAHDDMAIRTGRELAEAEEDLRKLKASPDDPKSEMRAGLIEAAIYRRGKALTINQETDRERTKVKYKRNDLGLMTTVIIAEADTIEVQREIEAEGNLRLGAISDAGLHGTGKVRLTFLPLSAFNKD